MGLEAVLAPLFTIRPVDWAAPDPRQVDSVLLTSGNAARMGGEKLGQFFHLPCYTAGEASAQAARVAGFRSVQAGPSDGEAALQMMIAAGAQRPLHLCGRDHVAPRHPQLQLLRRVVYSSDEVQRLPAQAIGAVRSGAVALLHSPRAALLFGKLIVLAGLDRKGTSIAAISAAAADAAGTGWRRVETATQPRDEALLELGAKLCETARSDTGNADEC
jgi:uroporphyrinogen-III synthase